MTKKPTKEERFEAAKARREKYKQSQEISGGSKLWTAEMEDMHLHWVNDENGRLEKMLAKGYEFYDSNAGDAKQIFSEEKNSGRKTQRVGTTAQGNTLRAHLMYIPQEWYEEDQAAKRKENNEKMDQVMRGRVGGAGVTDDDNITADIKFGGRRHKE